IPGAFSLDRAAKMIENRVRSSDQFFPMLDGASRIDTAQLASRPDFQHGHGIRVHAEHFCGDKQGKRNRQLLHQFDATLLKTPVEKSVDQCFDSRPQRGDSEGGETWTESLA